MLNFKNINIKIKIIVFLLITLTISLFYQFLRLFRWFDESSELGAGAVEFTTFGYFEISFLIILILGILILTIFEFEERIENKTLNKGFILFLSIPIPLILLILFFLSYGAIVIGKSIFISILILVFILFMTIKTKRIIFKKLQNN
jgi:hypothetical protein